ncbi:MAG: Ppx/GppA family phosphatase [Bacteroidetes bacterium]|nr:Ppx/GppA family phosphatase [Bacteroidota bacterium]
MNRVAAIDIGTNTVLMVVLERTSHETFNVLCDEHAIARMGKSVDSQKIILPESFERVENCLLRYKSIAEKLNVDKIVVCGTSALRDAKNQREFIDYIKSRLGITIQVLSGKEEARLTYIGSLVGWYEKMNTPVAVVDIGGGSTELAFGESTRLVSSMSIDIGSVRITERYLLHSPPETDELEEASAVIRAHLSTLPRVPISTTFVGVAGTITTLAAYIQNLITFQTSKIHRFMLWKDKVDLAYNTLKDLPYTELLSIPSIHPQRADIILAGILIVRLLMEEYNLSAITVSTQGLRYGLAYETLFAD